MIQIQNEELLHRVVSCHSIIQYEIIQKTKAINMIVCKYLGMKRSCEKLMFMKYCRYCDMFFFNTVYKWIVI